MDLPILSFWCIAPVGYLITMRFALDGSGYWCGMIVGASFSIILLFRRSRHKITEAKKQD
jgi:Na+-driven multidrug efflux pump